MIPANDFSCLEGTIKDEIFKQILLAETLLYMHRSKLEYMIADMDLILGFLHLLMLCK